MSAKIFEKNGLSDVKSRLFFVFFILIIYRFGVHIPVPLVDAKQLMHSFNENSTGLFSLFNLFSGGALSKVTIFSLGVMPYISSSIVIQLLSTIWDPLVKLKKEGEFGKRKITSYIRYCTVFLSFFQSIAMSNIILSISYNNFGLLQYSAVILTLVSGTMFLMWLGELINEKGIGNGISLIIFIGIISNLPKSVGLILEKIRQDEINIFFIFIFIFIIIFMLFLIIFFERAQRRIVINYPKRQQGRKVFSAQSTYLPFKINMSGVIPPIFASSLILFFATLIQWIDIGDNVIFNNVKNVFTPGHMPYLFLFSFLIIFFCFFYTSLVFKSSDTADNLKKSGGFIQGIRPGEHTSIYIDIIVKRLTFVGAIYLTFVSLLPEFFVFFFNIAFYFGGTSLLIVVVVIMDFISQVQSKMISHKYDGLIKRYKINGF